ncbi:MAG: glycoside hydrolase family 31 protein [Flavisolibacter sp.]
MKKIFLSIYLLAGLLASAQEGFQRKGNEFSFRSGSSVMKISFCGATSFRVRIARNEKFLPDEHLMVVRYDFPSVKLIASTKKSFILLQTDSLTLHVISFSFRIDVFNKEGKIISSESAIQEGGSFFKGDTVGCVKQLLPSEHFFGFGERMDVLDRRGKTLRLDVGRGSALPYILGAYNILEANYCPIPFFMSTSGYGIFFHNAFPTNWDIGQAQNNKYSFSAEGGELDYYFLYGPLFPSILDQYTQLTGRSPLMSLFAYGLHLGTYSGGSWGYEQYASDRYVIELARKLRAMGIPVDIFWLDSTWRIFGENGGKGATSFEWREGFNNPESMFDTLYALHYKMVGLHLRPRFDNGKKIRLLDTAQRNGFTYPEGNSPGEFVNFFDSASVDFWWKHGVMRVASIGARFLKTDEGSAFGALANESNKVGPKGKGIAELHNLFPLAYARAPFEKFQAFNHMRGLNQTREGYTGIQRYPFIFAGDWPSEWQYFAPVIRAGLNIGISGVGQWAHCMGGFEHAPDPELYIRWVQFGMFSPVAMVFGMDHPGYKEPWNYGPDALRNFRKYDSLRYRLLPYIYSTAHTLYTNGIPMMRALVLHYQDDENVFAIDDQYLFGPSLMVCPVTTKGAQTRTVYLPRGEWYDYWNGKKFEGEKWIQVLTPLDTIPVFARAGSVIAMQPAMSYVGEKPADTIELDVFPGNMTQDLYEDDGISLDYQKGIFSTTKITCSQKEKTLRIFIDKPSGSYSSKHHYRVSVHLSSPPSRILENNSVLQQQYSESGAGWRYNPSSGILFIRPAHNNSAAIDLFIE